MENTEEQVKEYFTDGLNITPDGFVEIQEGIFYSCMARFAERYAKQAVNAKLEEVDEIVNNRYSVALVFRKSELNKEVCLLRTLITNASSKEEALGLAIDYFKDETKGFSLSMKTTTKVIEDKDINSLKL